MKLRNVAVVGFALEPLVAHDAHRTAQELLYSAVRRTLADAGIERDAIDLQLAGSADYVDGKPFGFVQSLDVTGSWPPREDSHLEMDAAFAAYYGWLRIQAEECDTVMVVGYGKNSEGNLDRVSNIRLDPYYQATLGLEITSTSALQASAFIARTGASDRDLAAIAARNRNAGKGNAEALRKDGATADELVKTPWAVEPLREGYLSPPADTAVCLLLAAEEKAGSARSKPAWIHGIDQRAEMQTIGARDLSKSQSAALAAEKALAMAGIASAREVDLVELSATTPAEELILCEALGLDAKAAKPVVNPSGGPLCGNPFMMTGLIRLGEAFRQLTGAAEGRAIAGARRAIAHAAQGHCLQQNLIFILGSEKR